MIGLGCGARSYTRQIHYATRYATRSEAIRGILADYIGKTADQFQAVDYGFCLDLEDQQRRFAIISLLQTDGLSFAAYHSRFCADPFDDLPQLRELPQRGLAEITRDRIKLTAEGLERSDVIGPWLFSGTVRQRMEAYGWD